MLRFLLILLLWAFIKILHLRSRKTEKDVYQVWQKAVYYRLLSLFLLAFAEEKSLEQTLREMEGSVVVWDSEAVTGRGGRNRVLIQTFFLSLEKIRLIKSSSRSESSTQAPAYHMVDVIP
ncbi:hypothetical protein Tco_0004981 [Tanacetum coccineum]